MQIQPHKVRNFALTMESNGEVEAKGGEDAVDEDVGLGTERWF